MEWSKLCGVRTIRSKKIDRREVGSEEFVKSFKETQGIRLIHVNERLDGRRKDEGTPRGKTVTGRVE